PSLHPPSRAQPTPETNSKLDRNWGQRQKEMRIRNVRLSPIDEHHCVAHVAWTATYARKDQSKVAIDFDVHYLVQKLDGEPKVFGWISDDEQALLRKHGIV
ncbi:hypothetical protein NKH72_28140, partial [Mesorhizobium sp. M0955]